MGTAGSSIDTTGKKTPRELSGLAATNESCHSAIEVLGCRRSVPITAPVQLDKEEHDGGLAAGPDVPWPLVREAKHGSPARRNATLTNSV